MPNTPSKLPRHATCAALSIFYSERRRGALKRLKSPLVVVFGGATATLVNIRQWRATAAQVLTAIHDILRDNSPAMVVTRDGGHFRSWLDDDLRRARANLTRVTDGRG